MIYGMNNKKKKDYSELSDIADDQRSLNRKKIGNCFAHLNILIPWPLIFFFSFGFLVDCPIPVDITNANKLYDGVTNGSRTLYSCATGYTGSSNESMTHCVNGAWTTTTMTCTGRCCNTVTVCVRFYIKKNYIMLL